MEYDLDTQYADLLIEKFKYLWDERETYFKKFDGELPKYIALLEECSKPFSDIDKNDKNLNKNKDNYKVHFKKIIDCYKSDIDYNLNIYTNFENDYLKLYEEANKMNSMKIEELKTFLSKENVIKNINNAVNNLLIYRNMVFYIIEKCYPDINIENIKNNDIEKVKFGIKQDKRITEQYKNIMIMLNEY